MKGLLTMMLASAAVGLIAGAVYIAYVVNPQTWDAAVIILTSSTGASMMIRSAAHYRNAVHPKPNDNRQVTTIDTAYISGEQSREVTKYDHWTR